MHLKGKDATVEGPYGERQKDEETMSRRDAMIHALYDADLPVTFLNKDEAMQAYALVVDGWIEDGLIQSESFDEEVQRLRDRIHEAVNDCQDRFSPYVARCDKFDIWSAWAREHFERAGDTTWTHGSEANRLLILSLMEERDKALDQVKRLKIEKHIATLEWLVEPDNYDMMLDLHPELIARLYKALGIES